MGTDDIKNSIKKGAKSIRLIRSTYFGFRRFQDEWVNKVAKKSDYFFVNRSHGYDDLCIVLAGYKEPLWDVVLSRLERALDNNIDVCILTSGLKNETLQQMCERYSWSYLATSTNKLTLIQNLAIELHPHAKYIFKIDEDMFLPQSFFKTMKETYLDAEKSLRYDIGFVGALTPVNGYGYVRILEKLNLVDEWEKRFGKLVYTEGLHHHKDILENVKAARFMWGEDLPILRDIDALTEKFQSEPLTYSICPIRYSIGAILFTRESWIDWEKFPVVRGNCLGIDEERVCFWGMFSSKAIVVAENLVTGHLGYGPQTKEMLEFFKSHKDWFEAKLARK